MSNQEISRQTIAERKRLIEIIVNALPTDSAITIDQIGELVEQIENDYKRFLVLLWEQIKGKDSRSMDELLDKRYNRFMISAEYESVLTQAIADAEEVTLWEQISNSNYRDIKQLNALVVAYSTDLLAHITFDFLEEIKTI